MQTPTISTLQHGLLCFSRYLDILQVLAGGPSLYNLELPAHLLTNASVLKTHQLSLDVVMSALIHHDCGKYLALTEDEEGVHFRDHAAISARLYSSLFSNEPASWLIANDMLLHTCSADVLAKIIPTVDANKLLTLILCSYGELYANEQMFGGRESVSFKIKLKQLNKRSNQILKEVHYA